MPGTPTTRLSLPTINGGTDNVSTYPAVNLTQMDTLDAAAIYDTGTLVSRPTPADSIAGTLYQTTDSGKETLTWTDGSLWLPLGLIPQTTTSSVGVLSGQALITTGSSALTVTLPSHAAGQICTVVNGLSSTVATTVSGSSIQGLGLSSASSFLLGTPGASATLIDDGTSWRFLSGQQDTGWVALTLATNVIQLSGEYVPSVRVQGDTGRLKGVLENTGSTISANATLATVPASPVGLRPTDTDGIGWPMIGPGPSIVTGGVAASGAISIGVALPNSDYVVLDGLTYSLS